MIQKYFLFGLVLCVSSFGFALDLKKYSHLDPNHWVPEAPLVQALQYYEANYDKIPNKRYLTVIDMTRYILRKRMFIIDMKSGEVHDYYVAHGLGSDPLRMGWVFWFSNTPNSLQSSKGFYLTGKEYVGSFGRSLRLHGLEESNSKAYERAIVIHGAWYVDPKYLILGRTYGCPAVELQYVDEVVDMLKDGSLYYIYGGEGAFSLPLPPTQN